MRQRRTALKRRNHLGTHKCQNPISAPLVQDKSYTVRRSLHMFQWGSSGNHYGNERGQITWYRSPSKAGTKSWCPILEVESTKGGCNLHTLLHRLLINSCSEENCEMSLLHVCVVLQITLLCCWKDQKWQKCPYFFTWRAKVPVALRRISSRVLPLPSSLHLGGTWNSL